jgi:hypothetical protein
VFELHTAHPVLHGTHCPAVLMKNLVGQTQIPSVVKLKPETHVVQVTELLQVLQKFGQLEQYPTLSVVVVKKVFDGHAQVPVPLIGVAVATQLVQLVALEQVAHPEPQA